MKHILAILTAIVLALPATASILHSNITAIALSTACDGTYNDFAWQWSGYDDQACLLNYDTSVTGVTAVFRITRPQKGTIYLDVGSTNIVCNTATSIYWVVSRLDVPPIGNYYGELLTYTGASNNMRSVAQGQINITFSLYNNTSTWFSTHATNAVVGQIYIHPTWYTPTWTISGTNWTWWGPWQGYNPSDFGLAGGSVTNMLSTDTSIVWTDAGGPQPDGSVTAYVAGVVAGYVATNDARLTDARTPLAHNQAFSTITATPTTLLGYGILDAVTNTDGRLTDARVPLAHSQDFSTMTGTPTTLAGYGIVNAVTNDDARLTDARTPLAHNQDFSTVTGTPTSLAGYGILNAVTNDDARLTDSRTPLAHDQDWSTITNAPAFLTVEADTNALAQLAIEANRAAGVETGILAQVAANLTATTNHIANLSNPHAVTAAQVGAITNAAGWSGYDATQKITWTQSSVITNITSVLTNLTVAPAALPLEPDVSGVYTQVADVGNYPSWQNAALGVVISAVGLSNPAWEMVKGGGDSVWVRSASETPDGTYTPVVAATNNATVSFSYITNATYTVVYKAGYDTNSAAWVVALNSTNLLSVYPESNAFLKALSVPALELAGVSRTTWPDTNGLGQAIANASNATGAVAVLQASTSLWNQAATDATSATGAITMLQASTSLWNQASLDGVTATSAIPRITVLENSTSLWNQAATDASSATGAIVILQASTSLWNQAAADGTSATGDLAIIKLSTGAWTQAASDATAATGGVATLQDRVSLVETQLFAGAGTTGRVTSAAGDTNGFLRGDGVFATPAGAGDFKADGSVAMSGNLNGGGQEATNFVNLVYTNSLPYLNLLTNTATAAQGATADSAIQGASIAAGDADAVTTNAGNLAFTWNTNANSARYATAAQGATADAALPKSSTNALAVAALQITGGSPTNGAVFMATNVVGQGKWTRKLTKTVSFSTQTTNTSTITFSGVGFRPSGASAFACAACTFSWSHGFVDGSGTQRALYNLDPTYMADNGAATLALFTKVSGDAYWYLIFSSWTDDGAIFTQTKGSQVATNNVTGQFLFYP